MNKPKTPAALWESMKSVYALDRLMLPLLLLQAALKTGLDYLYTVLISAVVGQLAAGASLRKILLVTGIGLSLIFVTAVLTHLLNAAEKVRRERCQRLYVLRKNTCLMTMPFPDLDSPETRERLAKMNTEEAVGFGLPSLLVYLGELAQRLISVIISALLLALLIGGERQGLLFLRTGLFVAAAVIITFCFSAATKRANDAALAAIRNVFPPNIIINDFLHNESGISYQSGKDIRAYHYQKPIHNIYEAALEEMRSFDKVGGHLPALAMGCGGAVQGLIMGASYLFVLLSWQIRPEDLGWALLLAAALYQMTASIAGIAEMIGKCTAAADSVNRYMRFLSSNESADRPAVSQEAGRRGGTKNSAGDGILKVENLSFSYPGAAQETLRKISLELPKGSRTALVGANGSGKTTLVKLLCGLYRAQPGPVFWNGTDVSLLPPEDYASLFSVVFQDFQLFSLPLGEAVAVSDSYDAAHVRSVLHQAGAESFHEDALHTYLFKDFEDGIELSNGEAQKVALARALYRGTPILILDEPTAALDPTAEAEIYQRISRISRDTTILFISHRMSACRFCDQVVVMADGEIVQQGKHEELLMDQEGPYRTMWTAQAKYYTETE